MDFETAKATIPHSETRNGKVTKETRSKINNAIQKMRLLLIRNGIETNGKLSSQEKVLFAVVQWVCSEDLHPLFPPLVFHGTEPYNEKSDRRGQRKREKQNTAYSRLEQFIVSRSGGKWNKKPLHKLEILEAVLRYMENEPSAASPLPVPFMTAKSLLTEFEVNTQTVIQPLKHSVESILGNPRPVNATPLPIFLPTIHQLYFQHVISNMFEQNPILSPTENEENENGEEPVFFSTPKESQ